MPNPQGLPTPQPTPQPTRQPTPPEPSPWSFGEPESWVELDLVAVGADLAPGTLLAAYTSGLFPMPLDDELTVRLIQESRPGATETIGWFSPTQRGVLPLGGLVVSRSLRRSVRNFEIRINTSFEQVVRECGDPRRDGGWINESMVAAYCRLHELGWAHSVETWQDGRLVGGLYGVAIGGFFAGESMFHRVTDASKVALVALVERLSVAADRDRRLLDVQWATEHLESLGAIELERATYLRWLNEALELPGLPWPTPTGGDN